MNRILSRSPLVLLALIAALAGSCSHRGQEAKDETRPQATISEKGPEKGIEGIWQ